MNDDHKISVFTHAKAAKPIGEMSLDDLFREVRDGAHRAQIEGIRAEQDEDQQNELKKHLKAVTLSGEVTSGGRGKAMEEGRFAHSGFLQIDLDADDLQGQPPADVRDVLAEDPHIVTAFISPRGNGVKAVMLVPPAATEDAHTATFLSAESYMAATYELKVDTTTKDPVRMCFVSYDPEARWNSEAVPLVPITAEPSPAAPKPSKTSPSLKVGSKHATPKELTAQDVREMLATIPPHPSYDEWLKIASAVWDALGEAEGTAALCAWSPEEHAGEYAAKYPKRYERVTAGTLVHTAKEHGWKRERSQSTSSATSTAAGTRTETDTKDLLARAYAMAYDPDETPPPDEACMAIGDVAVAARGNLTALQGKSKVGKSAVVSAILGAAQRGQYAVKGDTLRFEWEGLAEGAIIHLDTEQSRADWHGLVTRSITRAGMPGVSDRLVSLPLVMFARSERLMILEGALAKEADRHGRIDVVIIDGIADLCKSPNDEAESLELVSRIHALAQKYECAIFAILHENPSTDQGKTRGHLGSELNRKAFANLRIDKDTETSISTIFGTDMRKRDLPKEQGFCFAWDDEAGMHLFQGRAAGLHAARKEAERAAKEREFFAPIFDFKRDKTPCPVLTVADALEIIRDIDGTENLPKADTLKRRMQRAENLGVLRKSKRGGWAFNPNGTNGT